MRKIVEMVAQKAGISESQAEQAVNTVAGFLKDKLPPGIAGQVDSYLGGDESSSSKDNTGGNSGSMADKAGGLADKAGGMFGKK